MDNLSLLSRHNRQLDRMECDQQHELQSHLCLISKWISPGNSSWSSGQTLNFTIDGLAIGTYNYTLAAFDGINGTTQNQINVTVLASILPVITPSANLTYTYLWPNEAISWMIADNSTNSPWYSLYVNGSIVNSTIPWTNNENISLPLASYPSGNYIFMLAVSNGIDPVQFSNISVIILADGAPNVVPSGNISYTLGTTGHVIGWTLSSGNLYNGTYTLYVNGVINQTGSWTSGQNLLVNVDGLSAGTYQYSLIVNDGINGITNSTMLVTVNGIFLPHDEYSLLPISSVRGYSMPLLSGL